MRTNLRRRDLGLVLAVLAVGMSVPELAQAQQSGLFPLAPIKRQRVPCDDQDPIYKIYKHQYFGYHPTCWRKFPDGWGCPSWAAPNREQAFKELPLGSGMGGEEQPPPDGDAPADTGGAGTRPALPNPPTNERSPFELDSPPAAPTAPRGRPATPRTDDPFDMPANPGTSATTPRTSGAPRTASPSLPGTNVPALSAPEDTSRPAAGGASARNDADGRTTADETEDGPILAMPNLTVSPIDDTTTGTNGTSTAPAPAAPAAPTPRRGLISGLFSNLGWNWTRR